ncbi:hypothetical protein Ddye_019484 [Dipteronia dyeriana]|uniref:Uncharacterized protein n=1 Tax=Dipteronia dyeriana TaxID=168575 RepID=A0AAD9TXV5_9ROSI|nr:hypothetical protein Ddye_019484 [Dipteronia dyeriana]
MAFSSCRASLSFHFPDIPGKNYQINSNQNLIAKASSSSSSSSQKFTNIIYDNSLVINSDYRLKHLTFPSTGQPILTTESDDDIQHVQHARKLKVFKHIFSQVGEDPSEGLAMIDAVQRLGMDYHFQDEIEEILPRQYMIAANYSTCTSTNDDLQQVALRFRLLRQEGYNVPADVFNNFIRNNKGKFIKWNVSEDIKGLIGLFEASQLSTGTGEDHLLDEAEDITAKFLNEYYSKMMDLDDDGNYYQVRVIVGNTLKYPHHKSLPRFVAKNLFLSNYQGENGWIHVLQELAKIDYNVVQSLHQNEIVQVSKWWKDLGLAKKLGFARDQPVKWYIWSMACLTDPSLSEQRIEVTKPISLIYIIDDIFDVYGKLDELTFFTETITRWDHAASEKLPDYLRICFKALDNITNEISYKVFKEHGYNPVHSLRKAWASLCNAFLVEAKWFDSGHLPKAEEYLENGIVSSGVHVGLVHIFFLLGKNITEENVELIDSHPGLISSTATILRLWDDLGSAKDENQEGKDGSYIHYYMMENLDTTTAECGRNHAIDKISNAWKSLNKECLSPNSFSATFTRACLNLARMVPLMYGYDENKRLPILEDYIKSLLFENTPTRGVY